MAIAAVPDVQVCVMRAAEAAHEAGRVQQMSNAVQADVISSTVDAIRVGAIEYPLRRTLRATYVPGQGEYLVEGFSPLFIGKGETQEQASLGWRNAVHLAFQELVNKRPFEMRDDERQMWNVLSDRIDVTVYRNRTLLSIRAFGCISRARPYPQQIEWEDGSKEAVSLDQVDSPDFVTFKPGQPFEAVVARDPVTFGLVRVLHIERRGKPSRLQPEAEAALLGEIGSSGQLEEADWE